MLFTYSERVFGLEVYVWKSGRSQTKFYFMKMKACFSCYFIGGGGLCGKFYGCRTALKKPKPQLLLLPIVPQDQLLRSISHWSQCQTSHWIQCSCYLFKKRKHFNWLRTTQAHIHLPYVNTFLFLLSPLSVSTYNVSLPICSVCTKLAKNFYCNEIGFSQKFKSGNIWKCITSPLGPKRAWLWRDHQPV